MKHVHLVGIGGTGLSAIARLLLESGAMVSGSDRVLSPFALSLRDAGARVFEGHNAANIAGAELVVRSSAIPDSNPEVQAALAAGIPVLKRSEFLGALTGSKRCLAVAGTHGKTTTTSMLAWVLTSLSLDPSFIIGGVSQNLGVNARAGQGEYFVIEADEYDYMFLGLVPAVEIITNIEHDHPDCFSTPEVYYHAFEQFAARLIAGGQMIACIEDAYAHRLLDGTRSSGRQAISYGFQPGADYQALNLTPNTEGGYSFQVVHHGEALCSVALQVPGKHNVLNALAVIAAVHQLGLDVTAAAGILHMFEGAGRRFEIRGTVAGITLVDDYAHHPTEIRATLSAARSFAPAARIWAVWQPHTYSRTQLLLPQFAHSFAEADHVIVTEIYASREPYSDFSASQVAAQIPQPVQFIPTLDGVTQYLLQNLKAGDFVLVLSAGDADAITTAVLDALRERIA